jgi:hypothetical protein
MTALAKTLAQGSRVKTVKTKTQQKNRKITATVGPRAAQQNNWNIKGHQHHHIRQ